MTYFPAKKQKVQAFTASGNWTRPAGVNAVEVFLVGGGGGGGYGHDGSNVSSGAGGGGGGEVTASAMFNVTGTAVGGNESRGLLLPH